MADAMRTKKRANSGAAALAAAPGLCWVPPMARESQGPPNRGRAELGGAAAASRRHCGRNCLPCVCVSCIILSPQTVRAHASLRIALVLTYRNKNPEKNLLFSRYTPQWGVRIDAIITVYKYYYK
jgi:hypothetical protein